MRLGLALSLSGHLALLAAGYIAFPEIRPFQAEEVEALPVELVSLAELRDVTLGERRAEPEPEAAPQPQPSAEAETPSPTLAERPAPRPVEAAREPQPRPVRDVTRQPRPEPPAPEQVAALPRQAEPAPAPPPRPTVAPESPSATDASEPSPERASEAVAPSPAPPKPRPSPPRQVAQLDPPREAPQPAAHRPERERPPAPAAPSEASFNIDDIAVLLNKQEPAGGGSPTPSPEPQTFGTIDGRFEAAMTQSEIEALKARLYRCWNPPRGVREAGALKVRVAISLLPDGGLAAVPQVIDAGSHPLSQIAAETAVRAVQVCAPYDILPPEKYSAWREIELTFDPSEMLGG